MLSILTLVDSGITIQLLSCIEGGCTRYKLVLEYSFIMSSLLILYFCVIEYLLIILVISISMYKYRPCFGSTLHKSVIYHLASTYQFLDYTDWSNITKTLAGDKHGAFSSTLRF